MSTVNTILAWKNTQLAQVSFNSSVLRELTEVQMAEISGGSGSITSNVTIITSDPDAIIVNNDFSKVHPGSSTLNFPTLIVREP